MGASESKLAFKEKIFALAGNPDLPADDVYWKDWYQLPETSEDVFTLWSPNDLRSITDASPTATTPPAPTGAAGAVARGGIHQQQPARANVESLVYAMVARLQALRNNPSFPHPDAAPAQHALNCIRVLTRLVPYLYESDSLAAWEQQFFWAARKPRKMWDKKHGRATTAFDGLKPSTEYIAQKEDDEIGRPMGEDLIDVLIELLFFPGFTLPHGADGTRDVRHTIWQSGIGCKSSPGMTKDNEANAMEVLRLLLTLTSRSMYMPPNIIATSGVKALTYLTTAQSRQVVLSLLCSLLNVVLKYNPAAWRVPFESLSLKDTKQQLVTSCLQLLLVLITYSVPDTTATPNAFRKALGRLHLPQDFQFVQQGLMMVLSHPLNGVTSYFPPAGKALPWAPEMLVLFWELLQCNKRFRSFIVDTDRAHDFTILVLYYAMDAKDDPGRQGIVRMCVFILQTMSVEPSFGRRLNKGFDHQETLPTVMRIQNFHGTYADYLISTIHTMLTATKGRLESIYPALLAIVNNIAPFVLNLGRAASSMLLELLGTMSSPGFLLANESNHVLLTSLLEALNAVIEHQYAANKRFVEVVLRSRKNFETLRDFTVEGAQEELYRQAQQRKDANAVIESPGVRSPVRVSSIDSVRSPVSASARTLSLSNVPEDSPFALGNDDEDDEDTDDLRHTPTRSSIASSRAGSVVGGSASADAGSAVPVQLGGLSQKARGKMPIGQGAFERQPSRSTSTTSLSSITNSSTGGITNTYTGTESNFTPTRDWLESWKSHLPLDTINALLKSNGAQNNQTPRLSSDARPRASNNANQRPAATAEFTTDTGSEVEIRVHTFTWTSLALGWYQSLLWSFIYASDIEVHKGSSSSFGGTAVRLFQVERSGRVDGPTLRRPAGAIDAVGSSLASRIGLQ